MTANGNGDSIGADHLRAALAVWRYCEASARLLFGEGESGDKGRKQEQKPLAIRVADAIAKNPGIMRSELLRKLRSATADDLSEALAWLRANGLAHPRECKGEGRSSECWYPGPEPTPPDGDGESDGKEGSMFAEANADADAPDADPPYSHKVPLHGELQPFTISLN